MNTQLLHRVCEKFGIAHDDILQEVASSRAGTSTSDRDARWEQTAEARADDDGWPSRDKRS